MTHNAWNIDYVNDLLLRDQTSITGDGSLDGGFGADGVATLSIDTRMPFHLR